MVYKLDRDAVQLLNHLLADTRGRLSPAAQDALNLRFELLYSRITLLREGEISSLLQSISAASELLDQIQQQLDTLDPMFEPHEDMDRLPVTALESELQSLTRLTERLVIAINGYLAESATEERALLSTLYKLLISLLIGISFAVLTVIVFWCVKCAKAQRRVENKSSSVNSSRSQRSRPKRPIMQSQTFSPWSVTKFVRRSMV